MTAWLHIVGLGEDGLDGLVPATRTVLETAEVIIGGERHHQLAPNIAAERLSWPHPFDALIDVLRDLKGKRVVVLATGDPLWYSVGARIGRSIPNEEIVFHPQLSAFQLASARMGWSLADVETLTVHGRPVEQMIPYIRPNGRLLLLTTGSETPGQIAGFLTERGYGASRISVLGAMGGENEVRFDGVANDWSHEVPAFNTMAVECIAGDDALVLPQMGLPDDAFVSDGTMTKQEVRAITLSKLMPMRGALLWDVGCGSGSVAIEWMRGARDALAIGIEPKEQRRAYAAQNAATLGAPRLKLIDGRSPEALGDLPAPDAVFVGGGVSEEVFDIAWAALKPLGRFVANAVTLEGEAVLRDLYAKHGGDLARISVERASPVGGLTGWRPAMAVTQWSLIKR
ncbi:precorrin-6y C5,15-methyltransferase (decarboxylating) subunit CbiE [Marivivens donghaensis]|uniref:Precorrin-6y C5,15-methyltransferase (Decarboxylating) subunit CbiE n=1 Tax=Marivivens donghaensis TaxID=1699413 RepID=A0ABX0VYH5_9RHOB|nr:precorrin-6y C5,15-methyltransferase (decarboxylating) subunit CbiE [Marivivens donghaensis]NIY71698.1 precorrin-6y C5,15-methyltransferase (decarboxylating) subunit CbiE [Marivivens donghaensis]